MNRHARRSQHRRIDRRMVETMRQSCSGSNGIGEIDVLPVCDIPAHRQGHEMTNAMLYWLRYGKHKCLFCDFKFPVAIEPPAFFFFARALSDDPKPWLISGVCKRCKERPDIADLLSQVVQPFFPHAELIDASPRKMQ